MARLIRIREPHSGFDCRFDLLDDVAPRSVALLAALAEGVPSFDAIHAMWTGPEISCPVPESLLPASIDLANFPLENATSYPAAGEIAIVYAPVGQWKGMPSHGFLDIGIFYGDGARLLMPMGWIMASVCARVIAEDMVALREGCAKIRRSGACRLTIELSV